MIYHIIALYRYVTKRVRYALISNNPFVIFASCSDEGLTLETSVQNHFHGVKLIYINLKLLHYTFILYADAD